MRSTKLQVIAPPSQNSALTCSHLTQKVDTKNGGYFGARKGSQEFFTCFLDYVSSISLIAPQIIKPILFAMNYTAIVELTVNRTP